MYHSFKDYEAWAAHHGVVAFRLARPVRIDGPRIVESQWTPEQKMISNHIDEIMENSMTVTNPDIMKEVEQSTKWLWEHNKIFVCVGHLDQAKPHWSMAALHIGCVTGPMCSLPCRRQRWRAECEKFIAMRSTSTRATPRSHWISHTLAHLHWRNTIRHAVTRCRNLWQNTFGQDILSYFHRRQVANGRLWQPCMAHFFVAVQHKFQTRAPQCVAMQRRQTRNDSVLFENIETDSRDHGHSD